MPCSAANTPPRSMSPTTITGRSAARASPMFAMSVARRLISAGLPAPSQITTSYSRRSCARLSAARSSSRAACCRYSTASTSPSGLPEHHHLAAPVAAGLEQHRVHPRVGLDARRRGLHGLGPADLGAVGGDERVQRHVLRLERGDAHPLPRAASGTGRRRARSCPRPTSCPLPEARLCMSALRSPRPAAAAATAVAAAAAVAAIVTARHRRTARRMSAGSGGRPPPRTGRCSAAPA